MVHAGTGIYKMLFVVPTPNSCRSEDPLPQHYINIVQFMKQGKSQHPLYIIVIVCMAMTSFLTGGNPTKLANHNLLTS